MFSSDLSSAEGNITNENVSKKKKCSKDFFTEKQSQPAYKRRSLSPLPIVEESFGN